jgi:hypothetical protein
MNKIALAWDVFVVIAICFSGYHGDYFIAFLLFLCMADFKTNK